MASSLSVIVEGSFERYDITAYENLVSMTEVLESSDAVESLEANLTAEQERFDHLTDSSQNLDPKQLVERGQGQG